MPLTSTFSTIAATQTAADKPLDTTLMDAMRQDIDVLYEWMGGPIYTPSTSHNHDGVNSRAVSGASYALIEKKTAASSATLDFTTGISSAYSEYVLVLKNIRPATNGVHMYIRVTTDGGSSFKSGVADYVNVARSYLSDGSSAAHSGTSDAIKPLGNTAAYNSAATGVSGEIKCFDLYNTSKRFRAVWSVGFQNTGAEEVFAEGSGRYDTSGTAINGLRLMFSSGNVEEGIAALYGIRDTA